MIRRILTICFAFSAFIAKSQSSSFDEKARAYVNQYADWAMEEQRRVGIPASITLAQGIYETGAGESELATKANNHFGIKCKKEWKGETFAHTDDAPNECFRKYSSAKESYIDHSDYLKKSVRYAELFTYDVSNYHAWAKGLKKCGYATNPAYAHKLIKMVEDYDLQQYTLAANKERVNEVVPMKEVSNEMIATKAENVKEVAAPISITQASDRAQQLVMNTSDDGTVRINDIRAFQAKKGEMLLDKAMKYNIRYAKLLEINELEDAPLPRDMHIYLEPKKYKGAHPTHIVQEGETIEMIAHNEGMSSRQLRIYNLMAHNEQAAPGSVLKLQEQADERPETFKTVKASKEPQIQNYKLKESTAQPVKDDYLPTKKSAIKVEEEIEIGYGAERPAFLQKDSVPTAVVSEVKAEPKTELAPEKKAEQIVVNEEPMDEIDRLKAKLDKAVYSRSSKSNMKVSSSDSSAVFTRSQGVTKSAAKELKETTSEALQYHIVAKGDTGYSIAKKYGISIKQLNEWNGLNFDGIKIGQKLRVK